MRTPARLGTLLLLALAALPAVAEEPLEETALRLETKLMSPCCMSGTVADHGSGIAIQMRREIRTMLGEGKTEREILDHYIAQHGPQILAVPEAKGFSLVAWLLPFVLLVAGAAGLSVTMRYWRSHQRPTPALPAGPVDPAYLERLQRELRELD
jgi:cytochrome c-type biogenesis protein CcmH